MLLCTEQAAGVGGGQPGGGEGTARRLELVGTHGAGVRNLATEATRRGNTHTDSRRRATHLASSSTSAHSVNTADGRSTAAGRGALRGKGVAAQAAQTTATGQATDTPPEQVATARWEPGAGANCKATGRRTDRRSTRHPPRHRSQCHLHPPRPCTWNCAPPRMEWPLHCKHSTAQPSPTVHTTRARLEAGACPCQRRCDLHVHHQSVRVGTTGARASRVGGLHSARAPLATPAPTGARGRSTQGLASCRGSPFSQS